MKNTDLMREVAKLWNALDDRQKEPFVKLSTQDELRYQKEMKELETKGYFINKDGVKSTDIEVKRKPA